MEARLSPVPKWKHLQYLPPTVDHNYPITAQDNTRQQCELCVQLGLINTAVTTESQ